MVGKTDQNGATAYTYDVNNRLIQVRTPQSEIYNYYYNPFGIRLWKEVNGVRTYFLNSDEGIIGEYDGNANEIKTYGYEPNSLWSTNPLFQRIGTSYYWYHNDHLGTSQKLVDKTGRIVWSATYDAFGNIDVAIAEIENNLRFPGQYYDRESGLHYNYFRYYDPRTGRYNTKDPIGLAGGDLNLYGYVGNNANNQIDPLGLLTIPFTTIWIPAGEQFGEESAIYWAELSINPNNRWYQTAIYFFNGWLASLWTPCTSDITLQVLSTSAGLRYQSIHLEPIRFGWDVPYTKLNIIHYGEHIDYQHHIALFFRAWKEALIHIDLKSTFPFVRKIY